MSSKYGSSDEEAYMHIRPIGGGNEVGRSCIILQFKGRNIMLDCGHHPGRVGIDGNPYFEYIEDPSEIDMILITHFHIDHCAALPYFTEKCTAPNAFAGRIFMTHATKAVMRMLLSDQIKLTQGTTRPLYTEAELNACLEKIECIDFHQTVEMKGVKFCATAAGHVLGACMYSIEIDGIRVLYTGDYSLEADRHLQQASLPPGGPPDVMIVESTFGITNLPPRAEREIKFTTTIENIVRKGGSCLIPVFALGRAQELLLILDEHWQANPDLQGIPVFYASKLAHKALRVYQTFVNMMNDHIRTMMDIGNPFKLAHVKSALKSDFDAVGACVVMASPGFLQNGVSRHLFERWCDDARNGVIIAGYTVEGTLAHQLLEQPQTITCQDNVIKPRRCQIEHVSFSAHVDYNDNLRFIKEVRPDTIILVHGEKNGMKRLKEELDKEIRRNWPVSHRPHVAMPDNQTVCKLRFPKAVTAECMGSLGEDLLQQLIRLEKQEGLGLGSGSNRDKEDMVIARKAVLVSENFVSRIVSADELSAYTSCRRGRVVQKVVIPVPAGLLGAAPSKSGWARGALLRALIPYLQELFEQVLWDDGQRSVGFGGPPAVPAPLTAHADVGQTSLIVQGVARVCEDYSPQGGQSNSISAYGPSAGNSVNLPLSLLVVWEAAPSNDCVADCAVGAILQALSVSSLLQLSLAGTSLGANANADVEGGLYKGSKKRTHAHPKDEPGNTLSVASPAQEEEAEARINAIIRKMQAGQVDPARAIHQEHVTFSLPTSADANASGNAPAESKGALELNRTRLANLRQQLSQKAASLFDNISVTADGLKLLFTAAAAKKSAKKIKTEGVVAGPAQCYVYILFLEGGRHEAVAWSDADDFKAEVLGLLRSL